MLCYEFTVSHAAKGLARYSKQMQVAQGQGLVRVCVSYICCCIQLLIVLKTSRPLAICTGGVFPVIKDLTCTCSGHYLQLVLVVFLLCQPAHCLSCTHDLHPSCCCPLQLALCGGGGVRGVYIGGSDFM